MERQSGTVTDRDERRRDLWRSLGFGLLIVSPAVLIVGNHLVPEVPGRGLTPFDVAGPSFVCGVLPLYIALAFRGAWRAGLVLVLSYEVALTVLTGLWVGGLAGGTIGIANLVVTGLILLAWRREQGQAG